MGAGTTSGREPIKVEAYSGYKAGETPRRIFLVGRSYDVNLIVFRKRVVDLKSYEEEDHFRIELKNYGTVNVVYKPHSDLWELDTTLKPETTFASSFE
ncbi:MAG: hypothetical protein WCX65_12865 [bacterium]